MAKHTEPQGKGKTPAAEAVEAGRKLAKQIETICMILEGGVYDEHEAKLIARIEAARKAFEGLARNTSDQERQLHCVRFLELLRDLCGGDNAQTDQEVALVAWSLFCSQAPQYVAQETDGVLTDIVAIVRARRLNKGGRGKRVLTSSVEAATDALCARLDWPRTTCARTNASHRK